MISLREMSSLKKKRILKAFIDAVKDVIKEEGIEGVTIRKVARLAGYNSATIYNYFDNLNQLIFFGAIGFLDDYVQAIPHYLQKGNTTLEQFLLIWDCFIDYSIKNPRIFYAIFSEDIGDRSENLFKKYYRLFPEDLSNIPKRYIPMLLESELSKRCSIHIQPCIEEGYFSPEQAVVIDEKIRLMYHGMLALLINNRLDYSIEESGKRLKTYLRDITYQASGQISG